MFKYYNPLQNRNGDALAGYLVRLFGPAGEAIDLFSDENGTPIVTESGVANAAKSDDLGMVRFYVDSGTYDIRLYDLTDTYISSEVGVPMIVGINEVTLAGEDGATKVGSSGGETVQEALNARPTLDYLDANGVTKLALEPTTSPTTGVVTKGGDRFIHNFDPGIVVAGQAGHSTFVGVNAGNLTNSSVWNTALGEGALTSITAAHLNTAVGARALTNNTTGQTNTAMGADAMVTNTTGGYNNAFGTKALRNNTTGGYNCAFGQSSMFWSNTGSNNSGFGNDTLAENASGDLNTAVGSRALNANVSGSHNTAVGAQSLLTALSTSDNNAFGFQALFRSTSGVQLCAFGTYALNYNTTGSYNVAFGNSALLLNTTGSYNVSIGYQSMQSNTTGGSNIAIGSQALYSNLTAAGSVAIGETTLYGSTGTGMTGIGLGAGYGVGGNQSSTVDTYCTFIGRHATRDSSVATATPITDSTCIGADAKVTKSHQVVIGASTVTETVLRGVQRGTTYAVNALPTGAAGDRAFVTDATATTFASAAAGGGSSNVPVYHDGTGWKIG